MGYGPVGGQPTCLETVMDVRTRCQPLGCTHRRALNWNASAGAVRKLCALLTCMWRPVLLLALLLLPVAPGAARRSLTLPPCRLQDDDSCIFRNCSGVAPPTNGVWGSCPANISNLTHGASCTLGCDVGFGATCVKSPPRVTATHTRTSTRARANTHHRVMNVACDSSPACPACAGPVAEWLWVGGPPIARQPSCFAGELTQAVQCLRTGCTDRAATNYAPPSLARQPCCSRACTAEHNAAPVQGHHISAT